MNKLKLFLDEHKENYDYEYKLIKKDKNNKILYI